MNKQKTNKPSIGIYTLYVLGAVACFAFFQFCYPYHLFYQEQNQLFLMSWDHVTTYLDKPGWLACLAGDFLTQFYYFRYAGPIILTLCILLTGYNIRCAVEMADIKGRWVAHSVAFIVMILLICFSFHYDYRLSSILAVAGGASVFRVSTSLLISTRMFIKKIERRNEQGLFLNGPGIANWISVISILVSVFVCHWFFGYGVWVYGALTFAGCLANIMMAGTYYRLAALIIPFFLLMLTKRLYYCDFQTIYTYPGIGKLVAPQMDLEKTLSVDCEYYFGNYNKVMHIVEKEENPNQYMKFYYNLVMAQNHCLSANLLKFPDNNLGTFETLGPNTPTLTIKTLNELYWVLGDMTFCERAAMLANVCSPNNRNIRMIKRLAEVNLVKGDYQATRKYLRILQKTFVWQRWADRVFASLGIHALPDEKALLQTYLDKRPFVNTQDTLRLSDNSYIIMKELVESNPANNIAINYMLCSDLLLKDMDTFKHDYDAYYFKQKHVQYDELYQEALTIYLAGTKAPPSEWAKYIKRQDVLQQFSQYNEQRGNPAFKDTYWYYFDKAKTPKLNNN